MAASAMDLTSRLIGKITGTASKSDVEFNAVTFAMAHSADVSLADGAVADQANQVYQDSATVIADAATSYDLAGVLTDEFGGTITFTIIKAILFKNTSTTASILGIGGGTGLDGTNAFDAWCCSAAGAGSGDGSEYVKVRPGGFFMLCAPDVTGYAVIAGTADILIIKELSTLAASFELTLIGVV